jgi:hypothetical protein
MPRKYSFPYNVGDQVIVDGNIKDPRLTDRVNEVFTIEKIIIFQEIPCVHLVGIEGEFWGGLFYTPNVKPKFKVGDIIKYQGFAHTHLINKDLVVEKVKDYGLGNDYILKLKDVPSHYSELHFIKAQKKHTKPHFREILSQLCNADKLTENSILSINIVNQQIDQASYNKNDLMTVVRTLEQYHVSADIKFNSGMMDAITVDITGEDIMEELGSNAPKTLPVTAIVELTNKLELTATLDDNPFIYTLVYGGAVYSIQELCVPPMQTDNEAG